MSDRRSFSEIPTEMLREAQDQAQIDRIWTRLERDLTARSTSRRLSARWSSVGLAALTFGVGVFVGARFFSAEPAPAPLLVAEPGGQVFGSVPASGPASAPSATERTHRGSEPSHHAANARRIGLGTVDPELAAVSVSKAASAPEWQRLSDEGQYVQALAAMESSGGFDAVLQSASTDQLMSLVDVARATGQRDRAITALRQVVADHGADPNAPVAAWMLGTELSKVQDYAAAERAFATYRALSPGGDFAEDALARQMDMAVEAGDLEDARKLGEQYIKEFPNGPRTAEIRGTLGTWSRDAGGSSTPVRESTPDGGPRR